MEIETIKKLSGEIHNWAIGKGFWEGEHSDEEKMVLVITELSEAVEADRRNKHAKLERFENFVKNSRIINGAHTDSGVTPEDSWIVKFKETIKDSVEDELADAYIRLLDLGKARKIVFDDYSYDWGAMELRADKRFKESSFAEIIYATMAPIFADNPIETVINQTMISIVWVCEHYGIDLEKHIRLKMEYNKSRERMHGKKY